MHGAGLARLTLEEEVQQVADASEAPQYILTQLPLPITHSDINFAFDAELKKRSGKVGRLTFSDGTVKEEMINPTQEGLFECSFLLHCESAGRRVGEAVERTLLDGWDGQGTEPKAGEQGYLDKLKLPGLTNCGKTVRFGGGIDVQDALKLLSRRRFWGPFVIATDADINTHEQRQTERSALLQLQGMQDVVATSALKRDKRVILQVTPDVVRIVVGLEPTLMQWDNGWKVACVIVPQVRCDCHGNVGVAVKRVQEA